jgi:DNA-binding CsgD family transcriptional regulator
MNVVALETAPQAHALQPINYLREVQAPAKKIGDMYAQIQTDRFGHVISQNWTAQTLLQSESVFRVENSVLLPADAKEDDQWFQTLLEVSRTQTPRLMLLKSDSSRVAVAITPNGDRSLEIRVQTGISVSERTLSVAFSSLGLTEAEREVLRCLLNGLKPKTIACRKFRSESTVRSHIKSLLAKCGCRSLQEVIVLFGRMPDLS